MLSNTSRILTYLTAILYAIVGSWLFFLPESMAPVFAWKVTPFMTMTIGGWCLGNAWLAWVIARRWDWRLVFAALLYLWLFGISELLVLFAFRDKLILAHPVAWMYLITLVVNVITSLAGLVDWIRIRPRLGPITRPMQTQHRVGLILYIIFVGFLGLYGVMAPVGAPGTNGGIFPEIMSPFTLRSFGVFYLSLALSVVPFLWNKNLDALLTYGFAAYGLIIFITLAALVYIGLFDFVARPGGLAYFAAYLVVAIRFIMLFRKFGTGTGH